MWGELFCIVQLVCAKHADLGGLGEYTGPGFFWKCAALRLNLVDLK